MIFATVPNEQLFVWGLLAVAGLVFVYMMYCLTRNSEPPVPNQNTIAGYLVDPDAKLPHVYVVPWACVQEYGHGRWIVYGKVSYYESPGGTVSVKLVRSGSGFRVYGHPEVKEGEWLPCR